MKTIYALILSLSLLIPLAPPLCLAGPSIVINKAVAIERNIVIWNFQAVGVSGTGLLVENVSLSSDIGVVNVSGFISTSRGIGMVSILNISAKLSETSAEIVGYLAMASHQSLIATFRSAVGLVGKELISNTVLRIATEIGVNVSQFKPISVSTDITKEVMDLAKKFGMDYLKVDLVRMNITVINNTMSLTVNVYGSRLDLEEYANATGDRCFIGVNEFGSGFARLKLAAAKRGLLVGLSMKARRPYEAMKSLDCLTHIASNSMKILQLVVATNANLLVLKPIVDAMTQLVQSAVPIVDLFTTYYGDLFFKAFSRVAPYTLSTLVVEDRGVLNITTMIKTPRLVSEDVARALLDSYARALRASPWKLAGLSLDVVDTRSLDITFVPKVPGVTNTIASPIHQIGDIEKTLERLKLIVIATIGAVAAQTAIIIYLLLRALRKR